MKDKIEELTEERGKNYGHPFHHFKCTQTQHEAWLDKRDTAVVQFDYAKERAFRHAVYMIHDKLSRMAENPHHEDNFDDICGYVKCAQDVLNYTGD